MVTKETIRKMVSATKMKSEDIFTTSDGRKFTDEVTADLWDLYLSMKSKIFSDFLFTPITASKLGQHFTQPLFGYRFKIDNLADFDNLFTIFVGLLMEHNGEPKKEEIEKEIRKSKSRNDGWFGCIYHENMKGEKKFEILYLSDLGYTISEE